MNSFKYIPYTKLVLINDLAIKRGANKTIEPRMLVERYDPTTRFPIKQAFMHNDDEIRVLVCMDENDRTVMLDMPVAVYNKLPNFYQTEVPGALDSLEALFADPQYPCCSDPDDLEAIFS
jgi:hypothetical protein